MTNINSNIPKSRTPTYKVYKAMKKRCRNVNTADYVNYGGRGIRVCDRWLNSFDNFLEDMGERPSPLHTINRIDNDGNYCPENCEWQTRKQQNNNTRKNHMLTYQGKTQSLAMWCDELHLRYHKIKKRLYRGWSIEKTFLIP